MTYKYSPDKNKLYKVDLSKIADFPPSYMPRLSDGDMVYIERTDIGYEYARKLGMPCYCVTVVKPLSKQIRCSLERNTVKYVPEDCLIPFDGSPLDIPFNRPVKNHKVKMEIIQAFRGGPKPEEKVLESKKVFQRRRISGVGVGPAEKEPEEIPAQKYKSPCRYCKTEININSIGGEVGLHECRPDRDGFLKLRIDNELDNRQNNMLIHGFLLACRMFVGDFGFHSSTAYIIRLSGIDKKDLIRCQIESEADSDIMLPLIEEAFEGDPPPSNYGYLNAKLERR